MPGVEAQLKVVQQMWPHGPQNHQRLQGQTFYCTCWCQLLCSMVMALRVLFSLQVSFLSLIEIRERRGNTRRRNTMTAHLNMLKVDR